MFWPYKLEPVQVQKSSRLPFLSHAPPSSLRRNFIHAKKTTTKKKGHVTKWGRRKSRAFGPMRVCCLTWKKKGERKKPRPGRVCQIRVRCIVSHARCGRVWPGAVFRILGGFQVYPAYQSRSMTQAFALPSRQDKHIYVEAQGDPTQQRDTCTVRPSLTFTDFKLLVLFFFYLQGWSLGLNVV